MFAGKIHAALYRAWKQRVKGRDWYDLVWFLRRGISMDARYLSECMRAGGTLRSGEVITEIKVKELLIQRVEEIDLEAAKEDVRPFLRDFTQLDLWTTDFFRHWISLLKFESSLSEP